MLVEYDIDMKNIHAHLHNGKNKINTDDGE